MIPNKIEFRGIETFINFQSGCNNNNNNNNNNNSKDYDY
jgi:hypothetical protein